MNLPALPLPHAFARHVLRSVLQTTAGTLVLVAALAASLVVPTSGTMPVEAHSTLVSADAGDTRPVEDYASYDGQSRCNPRAKRGAVALQNWLVTTYGGGRGPISRGCGVGGQSEHKEGRAVDWMMDADSRADRATVRRFLDEVFATDADGNAHAIARRMGIMYIIWNDRMWRGYDAFSVGDYRPCARPRACSKTVRHRDHVHISLSRAGGAGRTSWYDGRVRR